MPWLWIIGVLAALVVLLCVTRIGVRVYAAAGTVTVDAKISFFRIRMFPGKVKKQNAKQNTKKEKRTQVAQKKSLPKFSAADIKDAARTLWPPLKRALRRVRRGIRISPLDVCVTLGGAEDPPGMAKLYGYLHAGVWTVMPELEQLLEIRSPHIHVGIDFDACDTTAEGEIGVSARIGTLLAVGIAVAIPVLKWFLRYQKQKKEETPTQSAKAAA